VTTIYEEPVECGNCGQVIGAVEIASHNNFPGSMDLDSAFETIDKCPACDHRLDHEVVVWRDEPAPPGSP
jgi:hypothetical protein